MFAQLERLNNEDLTPDELEKEINRARAISEVGKVIVESAKTEVLALKLTGRLDPNKPPKFLEGMDEEDEAKPKQRLPGIYTNIPIRKAQ